ncbi:electron transfer flavoprotein subunit alpha/FixB family protein [Desulfuromonas thiophila]|uniref:electron transfer flavoprotein subunit alpha/FixB family protein n=1 Tax=Desulfuromonas thiophila TaxID=57664 RepID=UPI0029F5516F|nr:electron transfer flavoprotein subunit alpha/FixB family protein [Desulfuromonas thiophila]
MTTPAEKQENQTPASIAVFIEFIDGTVDDYGKGMLTEASRLANALASKWLVLGLGTLSPETLLLLASYGVDQVLQIDCDERQLESVDIQAELITQAVEHKGADVLLLAHNDLGDTLAPLLAHRLQAALFSEAVAYHADGSGLLLSRRALGFQVAETQRWTGRERLVLTASPDILSAVVLPSVKPGKVQLEAWRPTCRDRCGKTRIVERIPADPQTVDLVDAEAIISAGLGCDERTMEQVRELAWLLNASLGVTRPAYDLGYAGFERMVGQTGKTVAPAFYLALGISGSMHHVGGIKDSKRIVAVNIDPKAPIIPNADEVFVADLREVLPLLIERVKAAAGGSQ